MPQWLIAGRALCELGIRTLRDEIDEFPDLGREPQVIEAHTSLHVALAALDRVPERPTPEVLAEAQAACARAQHAIAAARARIALHRQTRAG
jgi:hypothetical protein